MIVRNEAHIVREVLDAVAPYIASWVIVDTGSTDGTQDLIQNHMASLGIVGELHERPWRHFGHNRSEALTLAQGYGDYIWIIDADDIVVGTPDFGQLSADAYNLRYCEGAGATYWRRQLFRDQLPWRYEGVVHEYATCDCAFVEDRLDGEYYIDSRRLGGRNLDPQKYVRDRDLLLAEIERNPDDERSVFYLAQSYFDLGDFVNAQKWYARRTQMAGWDEEVYCAMFRLAESMSQLAQPWPAVQDAYLRAWEFRPTRAEPLHAIAYRYRNDQRYELGHMFAERAAEIPLPQEDSLFVRADVHAWRAVDEQAVCASWIGKEAESFTLCRRLLARDDVPADDRQRIAGNRDVTVPVMLDAAFAYPGELAQSLVVGPRNAEVTISLIAGLDRNLAERTLNSFLRCCEGEAEGIRFLVLAAGLSVDDRAALLERYRFLEFRHCGDGPGAWLAQIRAEIEGRFWLHLGEGWSFFAPERVIRRLTAVLEAEPEVWQVGVNFGDAAKLSGTCVAEDDVRRADGAGRYALTDVVATGPAMYETARLDRAGGFDRDDTDPIAGLGRRAATAGLRTATLDEVLCIKDGWRYGSCTTVEKM